MSERRVSASPKNSSASATITPPWPKPLSDRALHGLAGEFVRLVEPGTETDRATLLFQFLAVVGNAVGRGPYVLVGATKHYANLFCAVVAESGESQKGAAFEYVAALFNDLDPGWHSRIVEGLSSGEGLLAVLDKRDDMRVLVVETELGSTLRKGGRLSQVLRQAWDGRSLSLVTKVDPLFIRDPYVSIVGHITPAELRAKLKDVELFNGFANRFIWPLARRSRFVAMPTPLCFESLREIGGKLEAALNVASGRKEMRLSRSALHLWEQVYRALARDSRKIEAPVISRAAPNVLRLSLIYALLDQARTVRRQHLLAGVAAWRYARDSAMWIFAMPDPRAERVLELLAGKTAGLTRTEIRDAFGRHGSARIGLVLAQLEAAQLIERAVKKTLGRPAEVWRART